MSKWLVESSLPDKSDPSPITELDIADEDAFSPDELPLPPPEDVIIRVGGRNSSYPSPPLITVQLSRTVQQLRKRTCPVWPWHKGLILCSGPIGLNVRITPALVPIHKLLSGATSKAVIRKHALLCCRIMSSHPENHVNKKWSDQTFIFLSHTQNWTLLGHFVNWTFHKHCFKNVLIMQARMFFYHDWYNCFHLALFLK